MKLHDFTASQPSEDAKKFRNLGRALAGLSAVTAPVAEAVKPVVKPQPAKKALTITKDMDGDGDVDAMDAAVAELAGDHKSVKTKIRNYD